MRWTDERVEVLKRLWSAGLSASQIAKQLGGVSRNSVIGKVHRLGLAGRDAAVRQEASKPRAASLRSIVVAGSLALKAAPAPAQAPRPAPAAKPMPVLRLVGTKLDPVEITELAPGACKWPVEERDGVHLFCGTPKSPSSANYCADHAAICFTPAKPRPLKPFYERSRYERPINSVREL